MRASLNFPFRLSTRRNAGSVENGARRLRRLTVSASAVRIISKSLNHFAVKHKYECRPARKSPLSPTFQPPVPAYPPQFKDGVEMRAPCTRAESPKQDRMERGVYAA